MPRALSPEVKDERIREVLQKVKSDSFCTIRNLALEFNLSESHLRHLFMQETGAGLGHLLAEQKLQRAAALLLNSNMRVKEIAYAVGYEHVSSFTRAFERRFGRAPRSYRQENRCA